MNTTICDAIRDGEIIEFKYDGLVKIVEPFCYGKGSDGDNLLQGYVIGGFSKGLQEGYSWEVFSEKDMGTVKFIGKKFKTLRAGYEQKGHHFVTTYCEFMG